MAVFLINRLPSKVIENKSPFEKLNGKTPDYTFLRTFGCAVWPNLRPFNSTKLQFRSKKCVFLGYSHLHKGFKCLDPAEGRIYISRDVIFDENIFPFSSLRLNAGARLRGEIVLLHPSLLSPNASFGDASLRDQFTSPTNPLPSSTDSTEHAGENFTTNGGFLPSPRRYFSCPHGDTVGARHEADVAAPHTGESTLARAPASSSDRAPEQ
jgi:histone deacetylase 1/2